MTTSKHTKKALMASVLSMLLCASMLVGSTFAWFTDSVTSGDNKIVAGNLDIELYRVEGDIETPVTEDTNLFMEGALWEPGHVEVINLKVANLGTLALQYQFRINVASEKPGTNMSGDPFKLSDYIKFAVIYEKKTFTADDAGRQAAVAAAEAANATSISQLTLDKNGVLYPHNADGSEQDVTLVVYMPTTVGSEANYKTGTEAPEINLGVTLVATQTPHESDSFDEKYDDLDFDTAYAGEIISSLKDASPSADVLNDFVITQDTERMNISSDKNIDFNGNTVLRESGTGSGLLIGEEGYNPSPVTVTMENANFISEANSAAVRVESGSTATFKKCRFTGREAFQAYAEDDTTTLVFEDCTFDGEINLATASGDSRNYDVIFRNCTFIGTFGNGGAAVALGPHAYGSVVLENCSIDIEQTGNFVCGIDVGTYQGNLSAGQSMTVTLKNTDIKVTNLGTGTNGVPVNITSEEVTTFTYDETCTFIRNDKEMVYDSENGKWDEVI